MSDDAVDADYIIVGSGAGGGTLAAALAVKGFSVLVLEAGADPDGASAHPEAGMPEDYEVPAFHAQASENPAIAWDFFVEHHADAVVASRDSKRTPRGIFYPRASTLGGSTAHHALISMPPPRQDWDALAELSGEPAWRGDAMERHWQAMEDCRHRPFWRLLRHLGLGDTGHGWHGWLTTQMAMPVAALRDRAMIAMMAASALAAFEGIPHWWATLRTLLSARGDPNDVRCRDAEMLCYAPLSTQNHARHSVRERLRAVARDGRVTMVFNALATGLVFSDAGRVIGVDARAGPRLYDAHPGVRGTAIASRRFRAGHEVILAGGTFNTPQLLMLSGIGAADDLRAHGIAVRVDLPGVGRNLHDRYEVGVVHRLRKPWAALKKARFDRADALFAQWRDRRDGMYVSNGVALGVTRRSSPAQPLPDLWMMALLARFEGYVPGYSRTIANEHDALTWAILKARTHGREGRVTLASADPTDMPQIQFNSFKGSGADADLDAVVAGVAMARAIAAPLVRAGRMTETLPGPAVQGDALRQWVHDNAWGHHAAGTAKIGAREADGVVDGRLRVHGVPGLRICDASVFPDLPGFFVSVPIMMVAAQAAEFLAEDAGC